MGLTTGAHGTWHTYSHFNFPAQLWQGTQINVNSFQWFNVKYDAVDWAFTSSLPSQTVYVEHHDENRKSSQLNQTALPNVHFGHLMWEF